MPYRFDCCLSETLFNRRASADLAQIPACGVSLSRCHHNTLVFSAVPTSLETSVSSIVLSKFLQDAAGAEAAKEVSKTAEQAPHGERSSSEVRTACFEG